VSIVSAIVLLATPAVWLATRPEANVGTPPWVRPLLEPRPRHVATASVLSAIEVHSARLADLEPPPRPPRPVGLRVPELGVDAPIVQVGVQAGGAMEVPRDVDTVGWYRYGSVPGSPGSALLVGHVDSRSQGPGVFIELARLEPGDLVRVRTASGSWRGFEVVSRRLVPKDRLPEGVFGRDGVPSLTLITCGGAFDRDAGHYTHNVLVSAVSRR
jgi:Sortase domain